jgi:hypothetical protein
LCPVTPLQMFWSLTPMGYSRPPVGLGSLRPSSLTEVHLGHPSVTVELGSLRPSSPTVRSILDTQGLQSDWALFALPASLRSILTPIGYSRTGLSSPFQPHCEVHLGHPRITVARQSDWALFALPAPLWGPSWTPKDYSRTGLSSPLDLTVANSAPGHYSRYWAYSSCADHHKWAVRVAQW